MNTPQLDLVEEQGKISFIEYTPTGFFILKIEKRKYRGTQIQSQVFQLNDEVHVIYNKRTQVVFAVLNQSKQVLYLDDCILAVEPDGYREFGRNALHVSLMCSLFLCVAYPFFQYFMDGTIYYLDTIIYLAIFAFVVFIWRFLYQMTRSKNENQFDCLADILKIFALPPLTKKMLQSLRLQNGYFFEFAKLYDFKYLFSSKPAIDDQKIISNLTEQISKTNKFGLNGIETERLTLKLCSGELKTTAIEKMESNRDNPDPLQEVKFKVDDRKLYGFFDEFIFTQGRNIQVVYTQTSDNDGHYAWMVYDQILYLSIDQDILQHRSKPIFEKFTPDETNPLPMAIGFGMVILVIIFGFFYAIVLAGIFGLLYFYGKFCYSIYLKMEKKRDVDGYMTEQISKLLPSINLQTFDQYQFVPYFNQNRVALSRTGFKKEYKVLD